MKKIVFGLCLYAAAMATQALELASESSMLNVVSVKNNRVAELFSFDAVTGQLNTTTGKALINIDLASIDSGIDIRDKRIKKYLFDVDNQPLATFNATIDTDALAAIEVSSPQAMTVEGELMLGGKRQALRFNTLVSRLENGDIRVVTTSPAFIDIAALGLEQGIDKLRQLAGLNSITLAVPVTFSVLFQ